MGTPPCPSVSKGLSELQVPHLLNGHDDKSSFSGLWRKPRKHAACLTNTYDHPHFHFSVASALGPFKCSPQPSSEAHTEVCLCDLGETLARVPNPACPHPCTMVELLNKCLYFLTEKNQKKRILL